MEKYWWDYIGNVPAYQDFFRDNIDEFKELHEDMYEASLALATFLDLPVYQTLGVSQITEFSTFCTSIVARTLDNKIAHVRNLDFGLTNVMKRLVYDALLVKDGQV